MNENALKEVYAQASKTHTMMSYEDFKVAMGKPANRKQIYELIKGGFAEPITYQQFEKNIGVSSGSTTTKFKFLPCVAKRGKPVTNKQGHVVIQYKITVWDSPTIVIYQSNDGVTCRFMVVDGKYKSRMGTAKCTPNNKIFYQLDTPGGKKQGGGNTIGGATKRTWNKVNFTLDDILSGKSSIKWGDSGPVVTEVQKIMNSLNLGSVSKSGQPDGKFGKRTNLAVKQFQGNNMSKGTMTGVVDSRTLKRMIELRDYDGSTKKTSTSTEKWMPQGVPDDAFNQQAPPDDNQTAPQSNTLSITQDPLSEDVKKIVSENLKSLLK